MLLCIKKLFMVFLHLQQGTGEAVANGILTLLGRNVLDVSNIHGQSYDGASAMAGTHTGTQARTIKSFCPLYPLSLSCIEFINSKFLHRTWCL